MTAQPGPKVFTIPPGQAFVDALARGILADHRQADDPFALTRVTVLLPTRRAVRALRDSFRRLTEAVQETPVLLPVIQTIGDVDEETLSLSGTSRPDLTLPPAIGGLRRQLMLSQLVKRWHDRDQDTAAKALPLDQAMRLAADLARFLDGLDTEEADLTRAKDLAPERFAAHWQKTVDFLSLLTEAWPAILTEDGAMDPIKRRGALIDAVVETWRAAPPPDPVIAAGSTGSIPATARLLKTIAGLPKGRVILPGLDCAMDETDWEALDPSHPQYGLKHLLGVLDLQRTDIPLWPGVRPEDGPAARIRLINTALLPAGSTDGWMAAKTDVTPDAVAGLERIEAPNQAAEARLIALRLREALDVPGQTAALVTPDRGLARRVTQDLRRWDIQVDDSAGVPLSLTPPALFLRLIAEAHAQDLAPVPLLSLLKHPFSRLGFSRARYTRLISQLERRVLRGLRPAPGLDGLKQAIGKRADGHADLMDLADRLQTAFSPLTALTEADETSLADWAMAHARAAEHLASEDPALDGKGAERLWAQDAGNALSVFLSEMLEEGGILPVARARDYAALFTTLTEGRVVRPATGLHPRLFIWGPLEARLQQPDLVILGGLNEKIWPEDPGIDPWLNRPMRAELGLSPPERRIGLAAHDFAMASAAPRVILTRSEKADGTPQVPSRWLLRLENLLKGAGLIDKDAGVDHLAPDQPYLAWADSLDTGPPVARAKPPAPRPPVETRPKGLSVTRIEALIRDPYTIYAQYILGLRPLDPVDRRPDPRIRGDILHDVLHRFTAQHPDDLPDDAFHQLEALGLEAFRPYFRWPGVRTFWWLRFEDAMGWFVDEERRWRREAGVAALEVDGRLSFDIGQGFTLRARADRIDRMADGSYAILDYKTGTPPSVKQVETGLNPQLPLEGLIASQGGFDGLTGGPVSCLRYLKLSGGREPGKAVDPAKEESDATALIEDVQAGLMRLLRDYANPDTPYLSRPRPKFLKYAGDYDHLARVKEWSVPDEEA